MLNLVLIGGKSAVKVEEIVTKNFDYLNITIFKSITDFYTTAQVRTMTIDRIILLQDAVTPDVDQKKLESLNNYLGKNYPAVRVITVLNKKPTIEMIANIFISPYMVHILVDRMKPQMLNDLVERRTEELKKKYGYTLDDSDSGVSTLEEIIEEFPEEALPEEVKVDSPSRAGKKQPEKKGLKGLFGKLGKKNKKAPETAFVGVDIPDAPPVPVAAEVEADVEGEVYDPEKSIDDSEVNFSVFEDKTNLGIGEMFQKELETPLAVGSLEDEEEEDLDMSVFDSEPEEPEYEEEQPVASVEIIDEPYEPFVAMTPTVPAGISYEIEPEPVKNVMEVKAATDDILNKLNSVKEGVFTPDVHIHTPSLKLGAKRLDPINLSEAQDEDASFEGIDDMLNAYRQSNIQVVEKVVEVEKFVDREVKVEVPVDRIVEVEKIVEIEKIVDREVPVEVEKIVEKRVEVPVEKIVERVVDREVPVEVEKIVERRVEVPVEVERIVNIGDKKRSYKNGIRTIIITGDRKTGVTSTALNTAAHFAKSSKTLFVDFDLERKGSLLYLGLDNIGAEEERVQNGLSNLKNVNILPNVTHNFLKGGFDCLLSMYGTPFEDEQINSIQRVLSVQREYRTLIIDCPLENLHHLEDIVLYSEVIICVEPDLPCALNTLLGLSQSSDNDKFLSFLFNNGQYYLPRSTNVPEFKKNVRYLVDMFSLDEENLNWGKIPVLGTASEFTKLVATF